jgi:hypothetical protein
MEPTIPPRRVAVYRCVCGEPGCGCVAVVIDDLGDRVRWSDARDYTGVYADPLTETDPRGGSALGLPDVVFDREQYLAELRRAAGDRSWETADRTTARRLRQLVTEREPVLEAQGYRLGWVAPHWALPGVYNVELKGPDGQLIASLTAAPGTPDACAQQMARALLEGDPSSWTSGLHH